MKLPREDQQTKNEKIDKWILRIMISAIIIVLALICVLLVIKK